MSDSAALTSAKLGADCLKSAAQPAEERRSSLFTCRRLQPSLSERDSTLVYVSLWCVKKKKTSSAVFSDLIPLFTQVKIWGITAVWGRGLLFIPPVCVCKTLMGSRPLMASVCVTAWHEGHRWGGHTPDGRSLSVFIWRLQVFTLQFFPRWIVVDSASPSDYAVKSKH